MHYITICISGEIICNNLKKCENPFDTRVKACYDNDTTEYFF